jgi:integrase
LDHYGDWGRVLLSGRCIPGWARTERQPPWLSSFPASLRRVMAALNFWKSTELRPLLRSRGINLSDAQVEQVTQGHIDLWQSTGPTTREHILRFIRWAIKAKLIASDLEVTPHRRGTAPRMPIAQQNAVIEQVAHQQTLHPRDRLAAILVIVFAQRAEDVAALTWDRITITADTVTIDLASLPIHLPPPLDEPVRALAPSRYNSQTAAHRNSPWVFRGYTPRRRPEAILSVIAANRGHGRCRPMPHTRKRGLPSRQMPTRARAKVLRLNQAPAYHGPTNCRHGQCRVDAFFEGD